MIVFTTKIPIKSTVTEQMFVDLCAEWIYRSPHYHNLKIEYDISSHNDYEIELNNIKCQIACYKKEDTSIVAFRLNNNDKGTLWIIDILLIDDKNGKFISVINNCNLKLFDPRFPKNHKPNFIKIIMNKNYGIDDRYFPVHDRKLICNKENAKIYAAYMNGEIKKPLPMVYISIYYDSYCVDCDTLAKWLSGMAYVVVEENREVSFLMKELTNSKNAHNGYVGIYYPGSAKHQLYCLSDFISTDNSYKFETGISLNLQQSLINHMSSEEYNWTNLQTLKAKEKLIESEGTSKELSDLIDLADENERELKEKIEYLQKENDSLSIQNEMLKNKKRNENICLKTGLNDFYIDEQHDLILYLLKEIFERKFNSETSKFRQHELLQSIIYNNDITGENEKILGGLKKIFKPGFRWNNITKSKLKSLGFEITEGSHNKIMFHDSKYMYTVSSTPSDNRGIRNLMSDIEKGISISRKIL